MVENILKTNQFPPALLLFGEEELLVEQTALQLFEAAKLLDPTQMNVDVLDADTTSVDAVLSIAKSFPMMSDKRIIWVKHAEKLTGTKDKKNDPIAQYLANPMNETFMLFTASIQSLDGISSAMKRNATTAKRKLSAIKYPLGSIIQYAPWVEYPKLKESQLVSWLVQQCKAASLTINQDAAEFMVLRAGTSLRDLQTELQKVQTYVGNAKNISQEDVLEVVGSGKVYNVFELQRAIGMADLQKSMLILTKMLSTEPQEMLILAMLTRWFLQLFQLIDCKHLTDRTEIVSRTGIQPFAVGDMITVCDKLGVRRIERALTILQQTEATLKSTSTDSLLVMQRALGGILA